MVSERGWRTPAVVALFLAPSLIPLALFTLGPMAASLGLSFLHWDLLRPPRLVGLTN